MLGGMSGARNVELRTRASLGPVCAFTGTLRAAVSKALESHLDVCIVFSRSLGGNRSRTRIPQPFPRDRSTRRQIRSNYGPCAHTCACARGVVGLLGFEPRTK